jgi:hypothetical protein
MRPWPLRMSVAVLLASAVVATAYAFGKGSAANLVRTGTPAAYARLMVGPPLAGSLAASRRVSAMARLAGIDPSGLRRIVSRRDSLASVVAGRDARGKTCVADASADAAGSFVCDPFELSPIFLVVESRGTRGHAAFAGFAGAADTVVRTLEVELADGSTRAVATNESGGFSYGATVPGAFPVTLIVHGPRGRILLRASLPNAAPPAS